MAHKNPFHHADGTNCASTRACEKAAHNYVIENTRAECTMAWSGELLNDLL